MLAVKIDAIRKLNPWHKTGKVPSKFLKPYRRRELFNLKQNIDNTELATLLVGGRRVGKSILMYQLIDELLAKGVDSKRIFFIQGDNSILHESIKRNIIHELIQIYQEYILDEDLTESENIVYIFIDEAHALPNWENEVKTILDLKYSTKFFLTGSSSHKLRGGKQSPLVGRVNLNLLAPFSFRDFVGYKIGMEMWEPWSKKIDELCESFIVNLKDGNDMNATLEAAKKISNFENIDLRKFFENYLYIGGFPYVIENAEREDVQKYLRDILTMTFSRDLLVEDQIKEPKAFERLMVNICMLISGTYKLNSLAERIGVKDERTVRRYIDYYVESHYVYQSPRFSKDHKQKSVKQDKKIYVADTGLVNTLLFKSEADLVKDKVFRSSLVENVIHNSLLVHKLGLHSVIFDNIAHWKNPETQKEIDFIYVLGNAILPIEVKTSSRVDKEKLEELKEFLARRDIASRAGVVVTEDTLTIKDNILFIPAYLLTFAL